MRASAQQALLLSGRDQQHSAAIAHVRMFSSKKDKKGALLALVSCLYWAMPASWIVIVLTATVASYLLC